MTTINCPECRKKMYALYGRKGSPTWIKTDIFYCFNCKIGVRQQVIK